tara:strand:- start:1894 stop:2610 length:717 start_codon:yes stop_codon:yes gene_type:complete
MGRKDVATAGALGGAATGAGIGTMLLPGIGTAVGGAIGGIAGGLAGYAHGGYTNPTPQISTTQQRQALGQMSGAIDQGRASVLGGYDNQILAQQRAQEEAIRQMRMGIAAPAAATLAGSGAAGLLGSGAAQAGGRQAALTAGLERDRMIQAGAQQEAGILQQKAAQELGFANEDLQAMQGRLSSIDISIENAKKANPTRGEFLMWAKSHRDSYPPGSPEWEKFNNSVVLVEGNMLFSA